MERISTDGVWLYLRVATHPVVRQILGRTLPRRVNVFVSGDEFDALLRAEREHYSPVELGEFIPQLGPEREELWRRGAIARLVPEAFAQLSASTPEQQFQFLQCGHVLTILAMGMNAASDGPYYVGPEASQAMAALILSHPKLEESAPDMMDLARCVAQ